MSNSSYEKELDEHGTCFSTTVGDSMEPMLYNRQCTVVLKKPIGTLKKYDLPLYKRPNGKYVLHRILKVRDKDYIICGDNRWYREKVPHEWIVGVVAGYYKGEKYIDCDKNKKYKAYVHLWCDFFWIRAGILWLCSLPKRIRKKLKK